MLKGVSASAVSDSWENSIVDVIQTRLEQGEEGRNRMRMTWRSEGLLIDCALAT